MRIHALPAAVLVSILCWSDTASAQLPQQTVRAAGHGRIQLSFDAESPTGNPRLLGCAFLGGSYYVSGRSLTSNHQVYRFSATGALTGQFAQRLTVATSAWGYHDGDTDGASLLFGSSDGVYVLDPNGNPRPLGGAVIATNGPQNLTSNPIRGAALTALGTIRGLAFDPSGNAGRGSLWGGNFGSPLVEFDLNGNILRQLANPGVSTYGLALDRATGNLWVSALNTGELGEINRTTGALTGARIARFDPASAPGGLSPGPGGDASLIALDQASGLLGRDRVTVYRNELIPTQVLGTREERLQLAHNSGPYSDAQFRPVAGGTALAFRVSGNHLPGQPNVTFLNLGTQAQVLGTTSIGGSMLPELVALSGLSVPPGLDLMATSLNGTPLSLVVPAAFMPDGGLIRMQALQLLPSLSLLATNQVYLTFAGGSARVRVEAVGHNSFNSDASQGFFRVTRLGAGSAIRRVVLSWNGSPPGQATMVWDQDSTTNGERFDAGNSTAAGCRGTYRNGSDAITGLDYAVSQVSPCNPTARTGYLGDNRTLDFRFVGNQFAGGRTFEFDCDTDGGLGVTGADMAGLQVTVTLADNTTLSGALTVDPGSSVPRSFVDL